ncbi:MULTISPECIES: acyl carrier protein [unclassified Cyanobium]|uniref:acyl carrier protein n=1 Tax=unclassified Cyanobium TaxID=2627006 RepID=UPI0020CBDDE9|nr:MULTISPECIES: acyl carrier protein [unclassified Cyanobium]MCP9835112.1 acyl carrier protein [Cyanobium sp. La Preciosa 7G6]MCP9937875.1 acyl carrier protein [Cyanobium sp. Aljojuca 7A6]
MSSTVKKIDQALLREMSDEEIVEEIVIILRRVVPHDIDDIQLDSSLVGDIGIDSLGTYELVMDAEDRFGIEIKDDQLLELSTVRDIVDFVKEQVE